MSINRLQPHEASAYLLEKHGISRTVGTLAKFRVLGGGPAFRKIGARTVVYDTADLDAWIETKISSPVTSTSEIQHVETGDFVDNSASLIDAAPDMLAVLKDFVSETRAYSSPECDECEIVGPLLRAADAAIAKAEGRS